MLVFPNAKINLGLYVTEKRTDGFHNIESIFLPVALCDALDVVPSNNNNFQMEILGAIIEGNIEDNICAKAWRLLHREYNVAGIRSELLKNIPMGAGLGGGSADGAFMLKLLDEIFNLKLSTKKLEEHAAELGSDCPFFIENKPKFVSGRGESLADIDFSLKGYFATIVHPAIHVSTPKAFSLIKPEPATTNLRNIASIPMNEWKDRIVNQFEKPIAALHPQILEIKQELYHQGALYASMSGSGSAVFGIFKEKKDLKAEFPNYFSRSVAFL